MGQRMSYSILSTQYSVLLISSLLTLALAGCQSASSSSPAEKPAASTNVNLIRGDAKALDELIAKHKGQVVLVDYWATWCLPCVENFPHTVLLAKKYRSQGLVAMAVSFDRLDDEPKVRQFLVQKGADFENVISQHDSIGQKTFADFDVGPLPEYRLYDRQGKLSQKWESGVDQVELTKRIEQLLAEKP